MTREPNKRPRRTPLTSEEVSNLIAIRQRRQMLALQRFKLTSTYKVLNLFNICCIFIYLELIFCYFGPCHYQRHYAYKVAANYGHSFENNKMIISELDLYCVDSELYKFVVNDFIEIPDKYTSFLLGKDFLLQKNLKGVLQSSDTSYRLFRASPILLLCVFISFICFMAYHFNLNENMFSLSGMTTLNVLTLFFILVV